MKKNTKKRHLSLFKITGVSSAIVIALLGCELIARVILPNPGSALGRYLEPYFITGNFYLRTSLGDPFLSTYDTYGYQRNNGLYFFRTNKVISGIEDRDYFLLNGRGALLNKEKGSKLIFAIGASAVQGVGASRDETTWFVHLENTLSRKLKQKVNILPIATASYVSTQERIALGFFSTHYQPDAIVILDGWNDVYTGKVAVRPGDPYNMNQVYESFYHPFVWAIKMFLSRNSVLYRNHLTNQYRINAHNEHVRLSKDKALLKKYIKSVVNIYKDNQVAMQKIARSMHAPVMTFLQPAQILTEKRTPSDPSTEGIGDDIFDATYRELIRQIPIFRSHGIQIEDLTGNFTKPDDFVDPVHLNDASQKKLADIMTAPVLKMLQQ